MCGIFLALGSLKYKDCSGCIQTLYARGPEACSVLEIASGGIIGFTRLAINGLTPDGMQPMDCSGTVFATNGEIYNWKELQTKYGFTCTSGSDCEAVGQLYQNYLNRPMEEFGEIFRAIDGVFATVIIDRDSRLAIVARDPYGVRPLYKGFRTVYTKDRVKETQLFFGSELKSMELCESVEHFKPGTYEVYDVSKRTLLYSARYHNHVTEPQPLFKDVEMAALTVRKSLEAAVKKRMMTERPCAALLSGGLDSSLIASLVAKELRAVNAPPLKTFSIGMKGSQDLFHAAIVAKWIGSEHTEIVLDENEFFNAIPDVIHAIESYDTTTVRASVGNWLVSREVAKTDCKVVFNGDGADELFGSYLYMYKAPSLKEYEMESLRLLEDIHMFDVLRSDRSISSHGLEPRTPFLDKTFVQTVLQIPAEYRRPSPTQPEKWLLRKAFDDGVTLPKEVLWRRKEAFSDGVSGEKPWYMIAQEKAVTALMGQNVPFYKHNPPYTSEMKYYRNIFEQYFPGFSNVVPYFWMPRWSNSTDPSAKTLDAV
jgi:asparagine synthase (glutamine-hydrolysing)